MTNADDAQTESDYDSDLLEDVPGRRGETETETARERQTERERDRGTPAPASAVRDNAGHMLTAAQPRVHRPRRDSIKTSHNQKMHLQVACACMQHSAERVKL